MRVLIRTRFQEVVRELLTIEMSIDEGSVTVRYNEIVIIILNDYNLYPEIVLWLSGAMSCGLISGHDIARL